MSGVRGASLFYLHALNISRRPINGLLLNRKKTGSMNLTSWKTKNRGNLT